MKTRIKIEPAFIFNCSFCEHKTASYNAYTISGFIRVVQEHLKTHNVELSN